MIHSSACALGQSTELIESTANTTTILESFRSQVMDRPFATALEVNEKSYTYGSLSARVDRLAQHLRTIGIGRSDVVAICLKRTENLVIGILGVLQAGAAYLPLNPSDPALRLGQVITHAASRCVLTDSASLSKLPPGMPHVLVLDQPLAAMALTDQRSPALAPEAADLAYVIYTSGTTGMPKGVAITHGSLANIVADLAARLEFSADDSWLAVTNVSFDIAALELLLPLCHGGKVILASEEQTRIGRVLAAILQHKKPSFMQATPITWRILIESGWAGSSNLTVLCGGDRLDRDLAKQLIARAASVWNMYGPTETTIWSTADKLSLQEDAATIGRPLANTEVYIVDGDGRRTDEIGEIYIGGAGVARGYVNDPQLTRRSFIDFDLGAGRSARVYRTGDLGRWNAQGKLEFYGRIDHQVKINGFRIELDEIESVIRKCPGIGDVAVLGVQGASSQKRLYAFVVGQSSAVIGASTIVAHLIRHLPKYMVPDKFWLLDRLPSTKNGKRDVGALEAIARVQAELAG